RQLDPSLKIIASPWSAPGWMKDNGSLVGSAPGARSTLLPQYYGAYANYFVKFVQAYQAAGVPVDAVTVQNEPQYVPSDYPGMWLTAAQEADFIKSYLARAFAANNITTKIVGFDHNWGFGD